MDKVQWWKIIILSPKQKGHHLSHKKGKFFSTERAPPRGAERASRLSKGIVDGPDFSHSLSSLSLKFGSSKTFLDGDTLGHHVSGARSAQKNFSALTIDMWKPDI